MIITQLFTHKKLWHGFFRNINEQGIAEGSAANDYFTRRKSEEDRIAGVKAPAKNKKNPANTDYAKKRKQQDVTEVESTVAENYEAFKKGIASSRAEHIKLYHELVALRAKKDAAKKDAAKKEEPKKQGVAEGYEPGDKITWYHSNHHPEIEGTVVGWKDGHLIVKSIDPQPRNTEKTVAKYRVPKNNILSHDKQGVAEGDTLMNKLHQALLQEGRVKELADDLKTLSDAEFIKKYGKAKAAIRRDMKKLDEQGVAEATGDERFDTMMGKITGGAGARQGVDNLNKSLTARTGSDPETALAKWGQEFIKWLEDLCRNFARQGVDRFSKLEKLSEFEDGGETMAHWLIEVAKQTKTAGITLADIQEFSSEFNTHGMWPWQQFPIAWSQNEWQDYKDQWTGPDGYIANLRHSPEQGVAEGSIGDKIKGAAKSVKRASQGWGVGAAPDMITPAGAVSAFKNMDGQRLANFVASRKDQSKPRKDSAGAFVDKVIDREMKQRGYGRVADKDEQGVAEGSQGTSVKAWAAQVRNEHGSDVKFTNDKHGGGTVNRAIARNSQGEIVGVYNRNTGDATVFEPKQGVAEGSEDMTWHGSNTDMGWYDAYKDQPVRVKVKNHSGLSSNPSGTFNIRSFKKIGPTKAELTINSRMGEMTGTVDLDNPETVVNKMYDRVPAMNFYIGSMPATPRQAFNLFQYKNKKQGVAEGDKKPYPKTWHDVDPKLGKQVDKMSQAEKVKKGLAHPDTLKKQGVAEGSTENAQDLHIGDPVIITGNGIEFEGATGEIIDFGRDHRFVVVNLYNHGRHSFHSSDVSFNEYAGSDDEEARAYDAGEFGDDPRDMYEARMSAARRMANAVDKQRAKSNASLARTPGSIPVDKERMIRDIATSNASPEHKKVAIDAVMKTMSEHRVKRQALMAQMLNSR